MNNYHVRVEISDVVDGTVLSIHITVSAPNVLDAAEKAQHIIVRNLDRATLESLTLKSVKTY